MEKLAVETWIVAWLRQMTASSFDELPGMNQAVLDDSATRTEKAVAAEIHRA